MLVLWDISYVSSRPLRYLAEPFKSTQSIKLCRVRESYPERWADLRQRLTVG